MCEHRYISTEITSDLDDVMPDAILIDRNAITSLLSQPVSAGPKLDALQSRAMNLPPVGDREMSRQMEGLLATPTGRRKIWDFSTHLHCSIIGTCLSTGELRHFLSKLGLKEATIATSSIRQRPRRKSVPHGRRRCYVGG